MSSMTARLQAMIATLDGVLEDDRVWQYPMTPSAMDECRQAMDQIKAASAPKRKPDLGPLHVTIDEHSPSKDDIRDWVDAFFSHPERIQIKRFEVKR